MALAIWLTLLSAPGDAEEGLPLSLGGGVAGPQEQGQKDEASFSIGPVAGYLKARDADRGTWFGGLQARLRFARILAIEGSISAHADSFQDGDIDVLQYPVQVSALLFPIPDSPIEPYGVFGAGWYFTRYQFDGALSSLHDETDREFALHAGVGLQIDLSPRFAVFADFRWVFLDEPGVNNGNLDEEEFDFGMATIGGSFGF